MDKDFALGMNVLGIWAGGLLVMIVATVAAPFLFVAALFSPQSPDQFIGDILTSLGLDGLVNL